MDHDKKLKDQFARHFNLKKGVPEVTLPGVASLRQMRAEIGKTRPAGVQVRLTPEQREVLGASRLPAPREFLRRLAEGLSKHPEISNETHVTPQSCAQTVAVYNGANQLLEGTGNAHEATLDALRVVDEQGVTQARAVLEAVHRMILSGKAPDGDVATLEVKFGQAFAEYERATQTRIVSQDAVVREQREQAEQARAKAAEVEALGKLLGERERDPRARK
jgi:hypothetical protein